MNKLWVYCFLFLMAFAHNNFLYSDRFYRPQELLEVTPGQSGWTQVDDANLVHRIIKSYKIAVNKKDSLGNSMWAHFFNDRHLYIHKIFMEERFNEARQILQDPSSTDLFHGFDMLTKSLNQYLFKTKDRIRYSKGSLDGLTRFGEAIGALRLYNPEGNNNLNMKVDGEGVMNSILSHIGFELSFPNPYPHEHGFVTSKGIISFRVPQALYQAWRIKEILKDIPNPKVLEIGAGLGRTAFFAKQFGIEDYTIVDLPITTLASSYFLGRTLGENEILLVDETSPSSSSQVKFMTPTDFLENGEFYDLIINVDGLTEMDPKIAKKYWDKITDCTKLFLSINHEINPHKVNELYRGCDKVESVSRTAYWLRKGYVDEIIKFK